MHHSCNVHFLHFLIVEGNRLVLKHLAFDSLCTVMIGIVCVCWLSNRSLQVHDCAVWWSGLHHILAGVECVTSSQVLVGVHAGATRGVLHDEGKCDGGGRRY